MSKKERKCEICSGATVDDLIKQANENIKRVGWSVVMIADHKPFAYTVGLFKSYGHPEIIMAGLPPNLMYSLLNDAGAMVRDKKETFRAGERHDGIVKGYHVLFSDVHDAEKKANFRMVHNVLGTWDFPAIQMLWPDTGGRFPGERGFEKKFDGLQDLDDSS